MFLIQTFFSDKHGHLLQYPVLPRPARTACEVGGTQMDVVQFSRPRRGRPHNVGTITGVKRHATSKPNCVAQFVAVSVQSTIGGECARGRR